MQIKTIKKGNARHCKLAHLSSITNPAQNTAVVSSVHTSKNTYIYIYKTLSQTAKGNFKNTLIQSHTPLTFDLHMQTVATLTSFYKVPLLTSVDVVPLLKTAGEVENSGHCIYSIGLRCF